MRLQSIAAAVALVLAMSISGCSPGNAPSPARQPTQESLLDGSATGAAGTMESASRKTVAGRVVPGEFLVKFKDGASKQHIARTLHKVAPTSIGAFKAVPGLRRLKVAPGVRLSTLNDAFGSQAQIEYVEPNFIVSTMAVPNDPEFPREWGLHNLGIDFGAADSDIDAPEAWDITTGSSNVVIAVVDSGVDYTHEDLAANIFSNPVECTVNGLDDDGNGYVDDCHGIDASSGGSDPMDSQNHGTHVAGTIGAVGNNSIGVAGVAWNVRILPCRFIGAEGSGTTADAIACLDYIADLKDRGVNVVATNNSWGGIDSSRALRDAIVAQRQRGILFVAAAGNDSEDNDLLPTYPCSVDVSNVVCVGATGANDHMPRFTNYGRSRVHLSAPGEGIISTVPGGGYDYGDGTSMAAPHVSGGIALLAAQDPTRDWRALKNLIIAGGDLLADADIPSFTVSGRRLNVAGALSCTDSVVLARMQPLTPSDRFRSDDVTTYRRPVGSPIPLKALHIDCASGNGAVTVSVTPSGELVTLRDDGAGSDEIAADGIYSATWTVPSAGTFMLTFEGVSGSAITIEGDAWLKPGFPVQTLSMDLYYDYLRSPTGSSTVVGNIDADPRPEILVAGLTYGPIYAWHDDGGEVLGWPVFEGGPVFPSLGELDGDSSSSEMVTPVGYLGIMAFGGNGALLPGWPRAPSATAPLPTVDVDGDGLDEIIGSPVRRADGSRLNPSVDRPISGPTSIADLDVDGEMDFISAHANEIWVSNRYGMLPDFPTSSEFGLPPEWATNIVVGDVDGDGHLELVVGAYEYPEYVGRVLVLSRTGLLERVLTTASTFVSTPALADLDGDGIPEIVATTQAQVYAWRGDGTLLPGWPVSTGSSGFMEPVVGDVSGDGQPDIVVVMPLSTPYRTARMQIYDRNGNPLPGFPMSLDTSAGVMPAAIADIDLDGRNDLVVGTNPDWGVRDGVFAFDLQGPGPFGPIEWGQHLGGAHHRGYYELGKNLSDHAYLTALAHGEGTIDGANGGIQCGTDCIERYPKGSSATLVATPSAQGRFNRWLGACAGQGNPCTVAIQRYTAVAAQFDSPLTVSLTGTGAGTVTSVPGGISCPGDCSELYDARTVVTLTATPAPNSGFDGWTGACSGAATTCTVTIEAASTVTAMFVTERRLTVEITGTGTGVITSSPAGIHCGSMCGANFAPNLLVTLSVVPAVDSTFTGWTVPCPYYLSTTCTVTMDMAKTMTATFARKVTLTVNRAGVGRGRVRTSPSDVIVCGDKCLGLFDRDDVFSISAEPDYNSYFIEWTGSCSGTNAHCLMIMNDEKSVTAHFGLNPVLTVAVIGSGRVQSSEGRISCAEGSCEAMYSLTQSVILTAVVGADQTFSGWGGACTGLATTCELTMDSATSVTATFTSSAGGGSGGTGGGVGAGSGSGGGGSHGLVESLLLFLLMCWRHRKHRAGELVS